MAKIGMRGAIPKRHIIAGELVALKVVAKRAAFHPGTLSIIRTVLQFLTGALRPGVLPDRISEAAGMDKADVGAAR